MGEKVGLVSTEMSGNGGKKVDFNIPMPFKYINQDRVKQSTPFSSINYNTEAGLDVVFD